MGIVDDPISGVLGAFFKRALDSKIWDRAQFAFELAVSVPASFMLICGAMLLLQQPIAMSIGGGLVAGGVATVLLAQTSQHAKGLTFAFVQSTQVKLDETTTTETIERK